MFCKPHGGIQTQIEQRPEWSYRGRSCCPTGRDIVFAISTGSHDDLDGIERLGLREDKEAVPINEAGPAALHFVFRAECHAFVDVIGIFQPSEHFLVDLDGENDRDGFPSAGDDLRFGQFCFHRRRIRER